MKNLNIIHQIIREQGMPFYFFDQEEFIENYKRFDAVFKSLYPNYQISYSYKTNYTPYVCELVKSLGGFAEVVSDMEYTLAKKLGYANNKIVYNGPYKGEKLYEHLDNNGIVNIDNIEEMNRVVRHANENEDRHFNVGLRINMDIGVDFISRFGFELGSADIKRAIDLIKNSHNISLTGLHCHISRARNIEAWKKRVELMLNAADKLIEGEPEYVSLGSGMFGCMSDELQRQFGFKVPTYEDYSEAVIAPFAQHYSSSVKKPILFTEPGTTLISKFISFVTRVVGVKCIRGRNLAIVDGSYQNLGEICSLKHLPFEFIERANCSDFPIKEKCYDIVGYTCLEQDLLHGGYYGTLSIGDVLCFENCGGYSIVSKPQFIHPNCPMYVIKDNNYSCIMREESFDDVFSKFNFGINKL